MKKQLFLIFTCVLGLIGWGQQRDVVIPNMLSPDASSLGKYNLFPVNKYTGMVNIDIPIYTIDFDGLKIPIHLTYATGGIRVAQEASKVGLGWILHDNAVITRTMKKHNDLRSPFGYIYMPHIPDTGPDKKLFDEMKAKINAYGDADGTNRTLDTEPDIFTLNLFGQSLTFNLIKKADNKGKIGIFKHSENGVKIKFNFTESDLENGARFTVVDNKGFTYFFNEIEKTSMYKRTPYQNIYCPNGSYRSHPRNAGNIKTSWLLTKITSPKGRNLYFNYNSQRIISQSKIIDNEIYPSICSRNFISGKFLSKIYDDSHSINIRAYSSDRKDIISPDQSYVNDVREYYLNGDFYLNAKPQKLDSLVIQNKQKQKVVKTVFQYDYFNQHKYKKPEDRYDYETVDENANWLRLKLDKVTINDKTYTFDYIQPDGLPLKTSKSVDFWGFYNGKDNKSLIANHPYGKNRGNPDNEHYGNRGSYFNFGDIGLLRRITYPTQGFQQLEYEPHEVSMINIKSSLTRNYLFYNSEAEETYIKISARKDAEAARDVSKTVNKTFLFSTPFGEDYRTTLTVNFSCTPTTTDCLYAFNRSVDMSPRVIIINNNTGENILTGHLVTNAGGGFEYDRHGKLISIRQSRTYDVILENNTRYTIKVEPIREANSRYYVHANIKLILPKKIPLNSAKKQIGGARIRSLTNHNFSGHMTSRREYNYDENLGSNRISSAKLMNDLMFLRTEKLRVDARPSVVVDDNTPLEDFVINLSSESTVGIENSAQGNHIGYSYVTEKIYGPAASKGTIITAYYNKPNQIRRGIVTSSSLSSGRYNVHALFFNNPFTYRLENGKMLTQKIYNNQNQLLKHKQYDYLAQIIKTAYQFKLFIPSSSYTSDVSRYKRAFRYALEQKTFLPEQIITTIHNLDPVGRNDSEITMNTEQKFTYNNLSLLKKQTTTDSKSQTIETNYEYAHDLSDRRLIGENRIAIPLRTTVKKSGKIISRQQTKYGSFGSLYLPQFVLSKKGSAALSETTDKKIIYDRYDDKGNLLQYHTENGLTTSILWDNAGEYPIAKVEGATYNQISNYKNRPNDLRKALPQAMVTTYTHKPLVGITGITKPNGQRETYEYDDFNRLKTVKDHNGKVLKTYKYNYRNK